MRLLLEIIIASMVAGVVVANILHRMREKVNPGAWTTMRKDGKYYLVADNDRTFEVPRHYWLVYRALRVTIWLIVGIGAISLIVFFVVYVLPKAFAYTPGTG